MFGVRRKGFYLKWIFIALVVIFLLVLVFDRKEYIELRHEFCDKYPNDLIKNIADENMLDAQENADNDLTRIESKLASLSLEPGGRWFKANSTQKVAIIVPYRDRLRNLKIFLNYMHIYLTRQGLVNYGIYLVEPHKDLTFNRALLINIGFLEALNDFNGYDCFIFHDVDMLPENNQNAYVCSPQFPKQFAVSISIYGYSTIEYFRNRYMGGVTAYTKDQFLKINGYSNSFYGWGGEDDDAYKRCMKFFPEIERLSPEVGRYFSNCHKREEENAIRFELLKNSERKIKKDGLNNIKYSVLKVKKTNIFTLLHVYY